jgi:adenylate cyclase
LAEPGGICVSRIVRDEVRDKLDFSFEDMGDQQVKNIARPVPTHRVRLESPADAAMTATLATARSSRPPPQKPSIAVLPFANMSGDAEQEYFSEGITEDIITNLSRNHAFFVISRGTSFTYKGPGVDDLGLELNQLLRKRRQPILVAIRAVISDVEAAAFDITELPHTLQKNFGV